MLATLVGCTLKADAESRTKANLLRVDAWLRQCQERGVVGADQCIAIHGKELGLAPDKYHALIEDGYGRKLITEPAMSCDRRRFCGPYSIGKNGVDNCGLSDDLLLDRCR